MTNKTPYEEISWALEGEHELPWHGNYIGVNFFNVSPGSAELLTDRILARLSEGGFKIVKYDSNDLEAALDTLVKEAIAYGSYRDTTTSEDELKVSLARQQVLAVLEGRTK